MSRRRLTGGFTLLETLLVAAIIVILFAIALALYSGLQRSARVSKASADVQILATSVDLYRDHHNALPPDLATVTVATFNAQMQRLGPFVSRVPDPPAGWSPYSYVVTGSSYSITASGDGTSVLVP